MSFKTLFSPGKIGTMEVKNRFVVPPMGTNYANEDGVTVWTHSTIKAIRGDGADIERSGGDCLADLKPSAFVLLSYSR